VYRILVVYFWYTFQFLILSEAIDKFKVILAGICISMLVNLF